MYRGANKNSGATKFDKFENDLEIILRYPSSEPVCLPLEFLESITDGFSSDQIIGTGGFGVVYKGMLRSGKVIAVKKISDMLLLDDNRYQRELEYLMGIVHKNVVRRVGYCMESKWGRVPSRRSQKHVMAEMRTRLLCFEYLGNGTLDKYIASDPMGFGWDRRYNIIEGICKGLYFLHEEWSIVHLDLKPQNIMIDDDMVPKIMDFGLSRLLGEEKSKTITQNVTGSLGYMAPEYIDLGEISREADIFSLGVIILEIITGHRKYPQTNLRHCQYSSDKNSTENIGASLQQFTDKELGRWRKIFESSRIDATLQEVYSQQLEQLIDISLKCVEPERKKRPHAWDILQIFIPNAGDIGSCDINGNNDHEKQRKMHHYPASVQTMELNILERVVAGSEEPSHLDLSLLNSITENFSEQRKIGLGGCGEVYKGILLNGIVAVKRLFNSRTIKSKMFHREVQSLITVRHENIVRFLGYCSFTEEHVSIFDGRIIMADIRERLLCFEYISNGNLQNHLTDELRGLEWHTRYEIIVGICKGLLYLHKEKDIIHMDLKPANILLDDLMVPKITDFGLSRLENNSQAVTTSRLMSPGYCAPEYFLKGKSSSKSDIYSLGVMVRELVTGSKKEPDLTKVLRRWRHRWIKASKHTPLGYKQVTKCLQLAQRCIQNDPKNRPDIVVITQELNALDSKDDQFQEIPPLEDMLGIEPLEIHFPFELDQQISHSIELSNDTDGYIAFMTKARLRHFCIEPNKGIVPPRSKCSVTIKMQAQVDKLPNDHYKKKITVLSTRVDGALAAMDGAGDMFIGKDRNVVDKVNVMVVFDTPPSANES